MADANVIEITVKTTDQTSAGIESVTKKTTMLKGKLAEVGGLAAGFLSAHVITAGIEGFKNLVSGSVEAASNLGESINAVQQVFAASSPTILDWGKKNAASFGLSQQAFNELATPMGALLSNMGIGMKDTANWTVNLTKRASDMASVFNTSVPDAMEALSAGLRGETDPLERFGVHLSAAAVQQEAMTETGKKHAKQLTDQENTTARLNLIMKETASTSGDFARTSNQLANSQRIEEAKTQDLQAAIGQKLLPMTLLLTRAKLALVEVLANYVLPAFNAMSDWIGKHMGLVGALAAVVGGVLVGAFYLWAAAAYAAAIATLTATWPILAIGAAIGLLAAGIIYAYNHFQVFRVVVDTVCHAIAVSFQWLAGVIGTVIGWITAHWDTIANILMVPIRIAAAFINAQWQNIQATAKLAIDAVIFVFVTLPQRIATAVGNLGTLLKQKGRDVIQGLWDGLTEIWGKVTGWISGLGGWIKDHKGPLSFDRNLLKENGSAIMQSLWDGLKSKWGSVTSWVSGIAGNIAGGIGGKVGSGVERWRGVALQALAYTHSPASWIGSLLRRMQQESGGNQFAINLNDSNARAGDPSRGLMQTIMGTFRAYAGDLTMRGIYDPLANIVASIRYANAAYGSAPRGWDRAGGYDRGGWLMPGTTLAHNATGRPEMVLTQSQMAALGGGHVVIEVHSGGTRLDDVLVDIIRQAVRVRGGDVQSALGRG